MTVDKNTGLIDHHYKSIKPYTKMRPTTAVLGKTNKKKVDLMKLINDAEEEHDDDDDVQDIIVDSVEGVRNRLETSNKYCIQLQVCHMEVPAIKGTNKDMVHMYLIDPSTNLNDQVLHTFSDRLGDLINKKKMTTTLNKSLVRVTVWECNLEQCLQKFSLGNMVRIKKFTSLKAFREMLQLNCVIENISMATKSI